MEKSEYVDNYIAEAGDFAKPILTKIRELVHQACSEIVEVKKWSFPNFEYKGQILCSMAAHKKHCSFSFWLGNEMPDPDGLLQQIGKTAMGHLGQLKSVSDLPKDEILIKYIKESVRLTEQGLKKNIKSETKEKKTAALPEVPAYLLEALEQNPDAKATFEKFSNSNKKEYIDWLTDAKTETTRNKRLTDAIQWLSEGKVRNWKYIK